jgi:hypothetical protein
MAKPNLLLAISSTKPKKPDVESEEESMDGLDTAAEEVLAAMKANDPAGLKLALKSFVSMCADDYGDDSPEE